MICCAGKRDTPFCPECGKALRAQNPLEELLVHCRRRLCIQQRERDNRKRPPDDEAIERLDRNIAKWERWCDALAAAMRAEVSEAIMERLRLAADKMVWAFPDEATDQEFNIPYQVREELRQAAEAAKGDSDAR